MKRNLFLAVSAIHLGYGTIAFANENTHPAENAPLSMEEILRWNSEYKANEPSAAFYSESQVGGPPVFPPQVSADILKKALQSTNNAQQQFAQISDVNSLPSAETRDAIISEGQTGKNLGPVVKPKDSVTPKPLNKPKSDAPAFEIGLPLLLDERYLGELSVRVAGEAVFLPADKLVSLVSPDFTSATITDLENAAIDGYLEIGTFSIEGLVFNYNSQLQQIELLSTNDSRDVRVLKFGVDDGFDISRDETQLIYDIFPRLMRFTAGDLRPRGDNLQTVPSILGLSVERFFDLEPNRLFRPTSQTGFELERPSTVEIRINGVTQREIFLRAGRYDIRDLPLVQGSNLVDVVIRDDLGRERIISDRNFFDFGLLEKGIWDYSIAGGVRSEFNNNGIDYTDDPIATAFIRGGISKTVTLGADIQADSDGANGGATALWASPIGVFRGGLSVSERKSIGSGFAADAAYNATGFFGEDATTRWTATLGGLYNSRNFSVLPTTALTPTNNIGGGIGSGLGGPLDGSLGGLQTTKFNLNGGFQLSQNKWSLTTNANYVQSYGNRRDTYNVIGGINYAISPQLSFGVFGRHIRSLIDEETGLNFQMTWRPGRNQDVRARYDTLRNEAQIEYSRSATPVVGSLNYSVGALSNFDTDSYTFNGDAFYISNRFEAFARHDVFTGAGPNNDTRQISRASMQSSIAFADGAIAIGRPIGESFAIVNQHKSLKGKKVYIDPSEAGYSSASGTFGPALAAEINPFSERSIYYDVQDLPIGYDLGEGQFNVKPPLNSGYKVQVGSGASYTVIGQVVDNRTGESVPYVGGRLENKDRPGSKPILAFTNRNGRLAATGLVPGSYKLILLTEPNYEQDIEIPDDGESLVNIGDIRITIPE